MLLRSGYYRLSTYLCTKLVLDALLLRVLPAALYTAVFYPLMRLAPQAAKVAAFFVVVALFSASVGTLAVAVSALTNSPGAWRTVGARSANAPQAGRLQGHCECATHQAYSTPATHTGSSAPNVDAKMATQVQHATTPLLSRMHFHFFAAHIN